MLLLLLAVTAVFADHFALVAPAGPPVITSDVLARPAGRRDAAIWTQGRDLYVYGGVTSTGRTRDFWKFEAVWHRIEFGARLNLVQRPTGCCSCKRGTNIPSGQGTRRWIWFPNGPGPTGRSAMQYWNMANQFWFHGGIDDSGSVSNDLWSFTLSDRVWHAKTLDTGPVGVHDMPCWTRSVTSELFLYDDRVIWSYQIIENTWTAHNVSGAPVIGTGSSFAQVDNQVYIVCKDGYLYRLAIDSMSWTALGSAGPPPRENGHLFATRTNDALLFFGGLKGSQQHRDFWRYNLNTDTWSELADAVKPTARCGGAVVRDAQNTLYLLGGGVEPENDIWYRRLSFSFVAKR